jgi:hypothetical protein
MTTPVPTIHPFPARMAPEIALAECARLEPGSLLLDPMAGSGTSVRAATESGHRAIGVDMDPLAVLIARVWTRPIDVDNIAGLAAALTSKAKAQAAGVTVPWIDEDPETQEFVERWFGAAQRRDLARLATTFHGQRGATVDLCRVALSRTIITKDRGASLARDVSHSRPHRVMDTNDFDVFAGFERALGFLLKRLRAHPPKPGASVRLGDARRLELEDGSVDAVVTSPPYLNAIDYLRGHRLSLVWLGHTVSELRTVRSSEIGTERGLRKERTPEDTKALERMGNVGALPSATVRILDRYISDLRVLLASIHRVVRDAGRVVVVVGNSSVRGVFLRNDVAVEDAAAQAGLTLARREERELPANKRYLPPPSGSSDLAQRMRTETVLYFDR